MKYDFFKIEKKWQKYWLENKTFKADNNSEKPKYYVLDMFPYPSGSGLHVGHPLGYIASDIVSRFKRSKGFNVLHPMGLIHLGYLLSNMLSKQDSTLKKLQKKMLSDLKINWIN